MEKDKDILKESKELQKALQRRANITARTARLANAEKIRDKKKDHRMIAKLALLFRPRKFQKLQALVNAKEFSKARHLLLVMIYVLNPIRMTPLMNVTYRHVLKAKVNAAGSYVVPCPLHKTAGVYDDGKMIIPPIMKNHIANLYAKSKTKDREPLFGQYKSAGLMARRIRQTILSECDVTHVGYISTLRGILQRNLVKNRDDAYDMKTFLLHSEQTAIKHYRHTQVDECVNRASVAVQNLYNFGGESPDYANASVETESSNDSNNGNASNNESAEAESNNDNNNDDDSNNESANETESNNDNDNDG